MNNVFKLANPVFKKNPLGLVVLCPHYSSLCFLGQYLAGRKPFITARHVKHPNNYVVISKRQERDTKFDETVTASYHTCRQCTEIRAGAHNERIKG